MDYLHLFNGNADFEEEYEGPAYHEPWVSYTIDTEDVQYNKPSGQQEP
jgi:hypothetical protein